MNSILQSISDMHNKFKISSKEIPFSEQEKDFRYICMAEELGEYMDAKTEEDELDALVDLVVFALGTVERQGMLHVFNEAFNRVITANMKKELGENKKRGSFAIDLVKPDGWEAPDLTDLVKDL